MEILEQETQHRSRVRQVRAQEALDQHQMEAINGIEMLNLQQLQNLG